MPISLQDTKLAYAEKPQRAPQGPPHLSIMVKRVRSIVQAWLQSTGPTMELERTGPFRRSVLHEVGVAPTGKAACPLLIHARHAMHTHRALWAYIQT